MAEWVRALEWRPGCPWLESSGGNFASELWQFRLPHFAIVFRRRDQKPSSLLSGVYVRGSKGPTSLTWKCVQAWSPYLRKDIHMLEKI